MSEIPSTRADIDVLIQTKNEQANLPHAIESVRDWVRQVFVVDSGSSDRTVEIGRAMGATVVHQDWLGYARQKNWALDNLPFEASWIFILDADELILPELRDELLAIAARPIDQVEHTAFNINRYFIFLNKRIRHCGFYPSWNIRFFKRGKARYEEREVHEHMLVDGEVGYLKGHMEHNDRRGLEHYMAKHNHYSTLEAREIYRVMIGQSQANYQAKFFGDTQQRNRWIKKYIYPQLPAKWLARFVWMYVFKLGFLDGMAGLRFSLFMSAYELLIGLKLVEIKQQEESASKSA